MQNLFICFFKFRIPKIEDWSEKRFSIQSKNPRKLAIEMAAAAGKGSALLSSKWSITATQVNQ